MAAVKRGILKATTSARRMAKLAESVEIMIISEISVFGFVVMAEAEVLLVVAEVLLVEEEVLLVVVDVLLVEEDFNEDLVEQERRIMWLA